MKKIYQAALICTIVLFGAVSSVVCAEGKPSGVLNKKCPTCNKLFPAETKFCGEDGATLVDAPETMVCPECKKEGDVGEKFCKEHGKKLIPGVAAVRDKDDGQKQKKELAKKYYKEGCDFCDSESYDAAIESYKKAEGLFPDFPALHYNMGWLYSKLGDVEKAVLHLQKYIVLAPDAKDVMEVQTYINVLKQAAEKQKAALDAIGDRDANLKKALAAQKQKFTSVVIPAGEFTMGSEEARLDATPEHRVFLDAYEIDRYEVTNAQYREFLDYLKKTNDHSKCFKGEPSGKDHTPRFWDNEYYNVPDYPVVRVDWYDAYAYAAWAGKRLPTEAEWEKAARGADKRRFPWGNEWDPVRCNLSGEPKPVGSLEANKSVYGCYDLAGSVHEWCADWYSDAYYAESPSRNPQGPERGLRKVIRGGSRFSKPFQVQSFTRKSEQPELFNSALGFRCAKDVISDAK